MLLASVHLVQLDRVTVSAKRGKAAVHKGVDLREVVRMVAAGLVRMRLVAAMVRDLLGKVAEAKGLVLSARAAVGRGLKVVVEDSHSITRLRLFWVAAKSPLRKNVNLENEN